MGNKDILNETRGEYILRMLKEQRATKTNITIESIHKELVSLSHFVYNYRTPDLAFKGEVYNALKQLNLNLLKLIENE